MCLHFSSVSCSHFPKTMHSTFLSAPGSAQPLNWAHFHFPKRRIAIDNLFLLIVSSLFINLQILPGFGFDPTILSKKLPILLLLFTCTTFLGAQYYCADKQYPKRWLSSHIKLYPSSIPVCRAVHQFIVWKLCELIHLNFVLFAIFFLALQKKNKLNFLSKGFSYLKLILVKWGLCASSVLV